MAIDAELLSIKKAAEAELKALGPDARPSQRAAAREKALSSALALVKAAPAKVGDAEKAAAFDRVASMLVEDRVAHIEGRLSGQGHLRDDDLKQYVLEGIETALFGRNCYDFFNAKLD